VDKENSLLTFGSVIMIGMFRKCRPLWSGLLIPVKLTSKNYIGQNKPATTFSRWRAPAMGYTKY
jgi:hypothetical protein